MKLICLAGVVAALTLAVSNAAARNLENPEPRTVASAPDGQSTTPQQPTDPAAHVPNPPEGMPNLPNGQKPQPGKPAPGAPAPAPSTLPSAPTPQTPEAAPTAQPAATGGAQPNAPALKSTPQYAPIPAGEIMNPDIPLNLPKDYKPVSPVRYVGGMSSSYINVDSWIYPAMLRLYSMGYVDTAYLGLRPWTRFSIVHMLEKTAFRLNEEKNNEEAREIYAAILDELAPDVDTGIAPNGRAQIDSIYTRFMAIAGTPLHDSFHLGSTIINDYGRPYQGGFNNITGFSAKAASGRFSIYFRGEYQHAPSATGYSAALAQTLAVIDDFPYPQSNSTIPEGHLASKNQFAVIEGYASAHLAGHEISFGKSDEWLSPAQGASMAWSNNAEDIYGFRINRVEPLNIKWVSKLIGPLRYDFLVGTLKGHSAPNAPWVHGEKFSIKPTRDLEIGFERTVIWGGKDHVPITFGSFWKSFYDINDTTNAEKFSRRDPGARFAAWDFSYRLPFVRRYLTLYTDSEVHDDVLSLAAPSRAAWRPGIYLSQFPHIPKLDLRVEGVYTDTPTNPSHLGRFMYWEVIQLQGYTIKGQLFGDWIGREGKGGQGWLTYNLSPSELVQFSYRRAKAAKYFILGEPVPGTTMPGGTTQNDYTGKIVKRLGKDFEINAWVQYETYKAPIYKSGKQSDTTTTIQFTWYPRSGKNF